MGLEEGAGFTIVPMFTFDAIHQRNAHRISLLNLEQLLRASSYILSVWHKQGHEEDSRKI